ncbi:MAG: hypothetical protein KDC66_23865, partial [Phaeodactylibacter sp.]|nr:hypothetical protein [Phaeodactylibacter sp.]
MYSKHPHGRYSPGPRRLMRGAFFVAALFLLSAVVMLLWNAILPVVTSAKPLTYPQALGLLVLSRILFGSIRFGQPGWGPPPPHKERYRAWREKWMNMSDEERAQF